DARMNFSFARTLAGAALMASLAACSSSSQTTTDGALPPPPGDGNTTDPLWCGRGIDVPGATAPTGFCLKNFAAIPEARALVAAPNGDLFVASPSASAPGGAVGGAGAIILLSDDDKDGVAEAHVFLSSLNASAKLSEVQGLALGGGYLYFTMK